MVDSVSSTLYVAPYVPPVQPGNQSGGDSGANAAAPTSLAAPAPSAFATNPIINNTATAATDNQSIVPITTYTSPVTSPTTYSLLDANSSLSAVIALQQQGNSANSTANNAFTLNQATTAYNQSIAQQQARSDQIAESKDFIPLVS